MARALSMSLAFIIAVAMIVAPSSARPERAPVSDRTVDFLNYTPRAGAGPRAHRWQEAQYDKGGICRNGRYACRMNQRGYIGWSCCGCGFCGWWSEN